MSTQKAKIKATKRGGRRPGAGRKPENINRVPITVRVRPEIHATFEDLRRENGLSQAGQFERMVGQNTEVSRGVRHERS